MIKSMTFSELREQLYKVEDLSKLAADDGAVTITDDKTGSRLAVVVDPAVFDLLQDVRALAKDPETYNRFLVPGNHLPSGGQARLSMYLDKSNSWF